MSINIISANFDVSYMNKSHIWFLDYDPKRSNNVITAIAEVDDHFRSTLYAEIAKKEDGKNLIMSALGMEYVLAVAYLGSKGNTASELENALSLPSKKNLIKGYNHVATSMKESTKAVTIKISNHVYVKEGIELKDQFKKDSNGLEKGIVKELSFSSPKKAAKAINRQVEKDTNRKIKELFSADSFDASTELVLVNAIYFKGKWKTKFDKKATRKSKFHISPSKTVDADMMKVQGKFAVTSIKGTKAKAIQLPYKGDRYHMIIILPDERNSLDEIDKDLEKIQFSKEVTFDKPSTYVVSIPKFKIEAKYDLVENMKQLGIKDLFTQGKANLSGFTGDKGLYASAMVQKAFVEVNEEGSEAAAATGLVVSSRSLTMPASFICDHPFEFFIKDSKTGLVLFNGRILDPSQ